MGRDWVYVDFGDFYGCTSLPLARVMPCSASISISSSMKLSRLFAASLVSASLIGAGYKLHMVCVRLSCFITLSRFTRLQTASTGLGVTFQGTMWKRRVRKKKYCSNDFSALWYAPENSNEAGITRKAVWQRRNRNKFQQHEVHNVLTNAEEALKGLEDEKYVEHRDRITRLRHVLHYCRDVLERVDPDLVQLPRLVALQDSLNSFGIEVKAFRGWDT